MSVSLNVLPVQIPDLLGKSFYKIILHILMDQYVVRSNACLSAVQCLSPCKPFSSYCDVCALVDDAWTFASQFEYYRSQVSGCSSHDCLAQRWASCEEDQVPTLFKKCGVNCSITLNHCNIPFFKCIGNHLFDSL